MARRRPTDDDRREAIETALNGLANGDDLGDVAAHLAPLHPPHNTFPGEELLDLAADAIGLSGASRQSALEFERIRERYLADGIAHTKASTTRASTRCAPRRCCTVASIPDCSTRFSGGEPTTCGTGR